MSISKDKDFASTEGTATLAVDNALSKSGVMFTSNTTPDLIIATTDSAITEMKITNNADCSGGSWIPYATSYSTYSLTATDGVKDISIQFRDATLKVSSCTSIQVTLDTTAPTSPTIAITPDYTDGSSVKFIKSATPTVTLNVTDAWIYKMKISNTADCSAGSYEDFATSKTWSLAAGEGVKNISVIYQDRFGQESTCATTSFVLDSTASAAPTMSLVEGSDGVGSMTVSPQVLIKNSASNETADATHSGFSAYQLRVTLASDSSEVVPWTSQGTSTTQQLTGLTLSDGVSYNLELRSVDKAGNGSAAVSTTWLSRVSTFYLTSVENATASTVYTSDTFTLSGAAGSIAISVNNSAKVCASPCADWTAASGSLTGTAGGTYAVRLTSGSSGAVSTTVSAGSYSTAWKVSVGTLCPTNYVIVPGENGTAQGEFCVAKYEMKIQGEDQGVQTYSAAYVAESRAGGTAWRDLNISQMVSSCQALGVGYDLITNAQWNVLARNIANVNANWSSGTKGTGMVNQGNRSFSSSVAASTNDDYGCFNIEDDDTSHTFAYPTDTTLCSSTVWNKYRRTHKLSNAAVIWDVSGGAWEGVKDTYSDTLTASYDLVADIVSGTFFKFYTGSQGFSCLSPSTNSYCGFGGAWLSNAAATQAIYRGGSASNGDDSGIFAIDFDYSRTFSNGNHGFRCVTTVSN